jgi:tetratricopeptide (TPR) repeat protein
METRTADHRAWCVAILLAALVIAAFWPAIDNGFVNWDDDTNFTNNPYYGGVGLAQLQWAWRATVIGVYQPVSWMALEVEYALFELDPRGYHLVSVLLHAANMALLFALAVVLLRRLWPEHYAVSPWTCLLGSALVVALYAVHPLRVEAVAWASCQPYLVCTFFCLLTVLAYLRAFPPGGAPRRGWITLALLCFLAALLSKAAAATLPVVLLILDVYPLRRIGWKKCGGWFGAPVGSVWLEKIPFVLASAPLMVIAIVVKRHAAFADAIQPTASPIVVAGQAAYAVWFYLVKTVIPVHLNAYYARYMLPQRNLWLWAELFGAILATLVVTAVAFVLRRRAPALLAAWAVYLVILAPTLGLVHISEQIATDRYCYVPMMGLVLLISATPFLVWAEREAGRMGSAAISAMAVVCLALLIVFTIAQCRTWNSSEALWSNAIRQGAGTSAAVSNYFGLAMADEGRDAEAMKSFRVSMALAPRYAEPHNNLGAALGRLGRLNEAEAEFKEAVRLFPAYHQAYTNLGTVLAKQLDPNRAAGLYSKSLCLEPDYRGALDNLQGLLSTHALRPDVEAAVQAILQNPRDPAGHEALAAALQKLGN